MYCEIFPHDVTPEELRAKHVVGVILSLSGLGILLMLNGYTLAVSLPFLG